MIPRTLAYLRLIRLPNLFTALADSVAGGLYVGASVEDWRSMLLLGSASVCLYAGGVALNDVCDVHADRRERPSRPIPSGCLTRRAAAAAACAMLAVGLGLAMLTSATSGGIALSIILAIVLYDGVLKNTRAAPALMGLCRALNLLLGMSLHEIEPALSALVPLFLLWAYVASLTSFARFEAGEIHSLRLRVSTMGMCLALLGLLILPMLHRATGLAYVLAVSVVVLVVFRSGRRAESTCRPADVQAAVMVFLKFMIAFDTLVVVSSRGWLAAVFVAWLIIPVVVLGRRLRMT